MAIRPDRRRKCRPNRGRVAGKAGRRRGDSPTWLSVYGITIAKSAGITYEAAIHDFPLAIGLQLFHADCAFDGNPRRYANEIDGETASAEAVKQFHQIKALWQQTRQSE